MPSSRPRPSAAAPSFGSASLPALGVFCSLLAAPIAAQGLCSASLSLSGTGNYVRVQNHPDLQPQNAVTYEAWFNPSSTASGRILSKGDGLSGTSNRTFDLNYGNNRVGAEFFLQTPTGRSYLGLIGASTPIPLNAWTHVAATFDSALAEVVLYIDGVLVDRQPTPAGATQFQSTTPLHLGATPPFNNQYFQGQINQVRIWDRAWTPPETVFRFIETPLLPGTKAQWSLDGHPFDLAGGHDGQIVGAPGWVGGCATWTNYRAGTSGPFGIPMLTASPPILGTTMNLQTDNASNAPALGVLVVGLQPANMPLAGGVLLADPLFVTVHPIGASGATIPFAVPNRQSLVGLPMFAQLGALYPNQTQPGLSAGLQWTIGT